MSTPHTIQSLTPTLCRLAGVPCPEGLPLALPAPLEAARLSFEGRHATRSLIFAPDALGRHLLHYDPALLAPLTLHAPLKAELQAVMPSVTPVCFASMYSGLSPAEHGIRSYAKPVLSCDTIFDYFARAGKQVAIVAVADSSIDHIFRMRPIEYYSESYDGEVVARCLQLLGENRHDLILAYVQEYDDQMHETGPFSEQALAAVRRNVAAFGELAAAAREAWRGHDYVLVVSPDHGAHLEANGTGDHGQDRPEDMEVDHYYGLWPKA